jgi:hypothetical protein
MAISDYIPNIFGAAAPSNYENLQTLGLITPQQVEQQRNTANIQGLLGAGLALAQGMSRIGPRRSAAENILGALSGGFSAAGGAYQQGIQNIVQQQQLQSAALQQQQNINRLKSIEAAKRTYPELAPLADIDPGKFAEEVALKERMGGVFGTKAGPQTPEGLRSQAQRAYIANNKPLGDSLIEMANRLEVESRIRPQAPQPSAEQPVPQAEVQQPVIEGQALPGLTVTATPGPDAQLQQRKNMLLAQNSALSGLATKEARDTLKANSDEIASIDKQLDRFAVSGYDFETLKKSVPEKFKSQIDAIKNLAQTQALGADQVRIAVQEVFKQAQESERGNKIEGLPGEFAQVRFGTTDRTKLTPEQGRQLLLFANAPTDDQIAQLQRESIRAQFETGRGTPSLPAGRSMYINAPAQRVVPQPVTSQQIAPQVVTPTQVTPTQTAPVVSRTAPQAQVRPRVSPQVTPQAAPQTQVTKTAAPENAPAETKNLYSYNQNALINKPDSDYSPKKKMELREKQAPLQSAVTYSLTSIKDARDAAQSLKNNPQYIDSLTGRFAPLLLKGGSAVSQDIQTANELLQNLLTRSFVKEIQAMREASPTGGAVGSVTEREMDALSKVSAALSIGMNKDEFIKQLDNYLSIANRSLKNIPIEYSKTFGYNGEFDEVLTTPGISTSRTSGKTPVQLELERRKKGKQ